jgi:manganese transport protein
MASAIEHAEDASQPAKVSVQKRGWGRRLFAFLGPAYLVSVGYMDPGNWATDIEGGARFGYTLIWVLLMSNLMAVLLQTLSARLGIVTGHDLAQGCRREYPRAVNLSLWVLAEIAIAATDLAEALGTIIGLNLLFRLPLLWGCVVTALDTFLFLALQRYGVRKMEAFILVLVATIGGCFLIEVFLSRPDWTSVAAGFVPHLDASALYIAIGIIGATVMPHNLFLHSALVQSRAVSNTYTGKNEACRYNLIDSVVALNAAFFVNAAILVTAAANFHARGIEVTEIQQAHAILDRLLGETLAPVAFAVALVAAGQSSTITGTISGQVVMEGFLDLRMVPWLRRLVTRLVALGPAVVVILLSGSEGVYELLVLSQVVLSLQLPFAIVPLVHFTADARKMGPFVNRRWVTIAAWVIAAVVIGLNVSLVWEKTGEWMTAGGRRLAVARAGAARRRFDGAAALSGLGTAGAARSRVGCRDGHRRAPGRRAHPAHEDPAHRRRARPRAGRCPHPVGGCGDSPRRAGAPLPDPRRGHARHNADGGAQRQPACRPGRVVPGGAGARARGAGSPGRGPAAVRAAG